MATATKPASDLAYLCRALKAPSLALSVERLAERARAESWTHEEFLAACLEREVAARQSNGGEIRVRGARFPAKKTLEEFDFDHQRSLKRDVIAHLGALDFIEAKENVVFLGPPGTGKTHLAIGISIRACQAGHRVQFATAAQWVDRLAEAHSAGRLQAELTRLGRYPSSSSTRSATSPSRPRRPICLPAGLGPLRAGQRHRDLQQALRALGGGLRRRGGGRRHDRPPGPPRRGRLDEG